MSTAAQMSLFDGAPDKPADYEATVESVAYREARAFVAAHTVRNVNDSFALNYAHDSRGLTVRDFHRTYWVPLQMRRLRIGLGLS